MPGRRPRGPKCPVCRAVMHVPEGGGDPVCSFEKSHKNIARMRMAANQKNPKKRKDKS